MKYTLYYSVLFMIHLKAKLIDRKETELLRLKILFLQFIQHQVSQSKIRYQFNSFWQIK